MNFVAQSAANTSPPRMGVQYEEVYCMAWRNCVLRALWASGICYDGPKGHQGNPRGPVHLPLWRFYAVSATMRDSFIDEDGVKVIIVPPHWCMLVRTFRGYHQPDACAECLRPFADTPWDMENSPPAPEPEWVSVGVSKHEEAPFLRHRILEIES